MVLAALVGHAHFTIAHYSRTKTRNNTHTTIFFSVWHSNDGTHDKRHERERESGRCVSYVSSPGRYCVYMCVGWTLLLFLLPP